MRIVALALVLSGCGAGRDARLLMPENATVSAPSAIGGRHAIFVATTRAAALDKAEVFGGGRSADLGFVKVDMTVPASHKIGSLEVPEGGRHDPAKYFATSSVTAYDEAAFEKALRADLKRSNGHALIFIHGFNTRFDEAVYRMTQIVHDARYAGTPVLFSWASSGNVTDYVYDANSATIARDRLEATLRLLARAGATKIFVLAHSMGTWVTMEALRQLAIAKDGDLGGRLDDVVLASPDIDVDVFKSQMARYGKPKRPFVILSSADDRALRFSSIIAGNRPRVGDDSNAADLAKLGVIVINLSAVESGDQLNHSKFADNPALIQLFGARLRSTDTFGAGDVNIEEQFGKLASGLGKVVTRAARIVITTPQRVVTLPVGGD